MDNSVPAIEQNMFCSSIRNSDITIQYKAHAGLATNEDDGLLYGSHLLASVCAGSAMVCIAKM